MPYTTLIDHIVAASGRGAEDIVVKDPHEIAACKNTAFWTNNVGKESNMFIMLKLLHGDERPQAATFDIYLKFASNGEVAIDIPMKVLISTASHKLGNFVILASQHITQVLITKPYFAVSMRLALDSASKYLMLTLRADPAITPVVRMGIISVHCRIPGTAASGMGLSAVNMRCKGALTILDERAKPADQVEVDAVENANQQTTGAQDNKLLVNGGSEESESDISSSQFSTSCTSILGGAQLEDVAQSGVKHFPATPDADLDDTQQLVISKYNIPTVPQTLSVPVSVILCDGTPIKGKEIFVDSNSLSAISKSCCGLKKTLLWTGAPAPTSITKVIYGIDCFDGRRSNKILTVLSKPCMGSDWSAIGIAFESSKDCRCVCSLLYGILRQNKSAAQILLHRVYLDVAVGFAQRLMAIASE